MEDFRRRIASDNRKRQQRLEKAIRKTLSRGTAIVRRNVPVAFSSLRDSVHIEGLKIVADAPHAAAVENGSRPHRPPLEPLIAWVKLRGMQGLQNDKQLARQSGTTTSSAARHVAGMLAEQRLHTFRGKLSGSMALAADAPTRVARAIQNAIAKRGTKPHHYMSTSLPEIMRILDSEIASALSD